MNTYVDMFAKFRPLWKDEGGQFKLLSKSDVMNFSVGGFTFEIDGKSIPHDFEATAVNYNDGTFCYESGYGPFFNTHYLDVCYDSEYAELEIERNTLTASVLSSAVRIEEFYANFLDNDEVEYGIEDNKENYPDLRLEIIEICFSDENANCFYVAPDVIRNFNIGYGGESHGQ